MKEKQEKKARRGMAILFTASLSVCVFAAVLFISGCGGGGGDSAAPNSSQRGMSVSLSLPRQALAPGDSYSVDVSVKTISATGASDAVVATATAQMAYDAANSRFYTTSPVSIPNIPVGTNYLLETIINVTTATSTYPVSYAGAIIDISDGAWNNVTVSPATSLAAMAMMRHGVQNSIALASIPDTMETAINNAISEFTSSTPTYAKSFYSSFLATHSVSYNINPFAPANWGSFGGMLTTLDSVVARANFILASSASTISYRISAMPMMVCAVLSNKSIKCWGDNSNGQLGDGTTVSSSVPVLVSGISNALMVTTGVVHTCALMPNGVKCWGGNYEGQLGNGTTTSSTSPVDVSGTNNASYISVGYGYSCAVFNDGTAKCWGDNTNGQLGDGTTTSSSSVVSVTQISNASNIAASNYINANNGHTCSLLTNGAVKCWGDNSNGQLGNGTTTASLSPVDVSGITNGVALTSGFRHSCVLLSDDNIKCWGYNSFGQLGNGTTTDSSIPVTVQFSSVPAVCGNSTVETGETCDDGNTTSGDGCSSTCNIEYHNQIASGGLYSCVIGSGSIKCWGQNGSGQLGNGATTDSYLPVSVSGITDAVSITASGSGHTCALRSNGTIKCWGNNQYGQLGDGTTNNSSTPVDVTGITNAVALSAGLNHTCSVLSDGSIKCWGLNDYSQLGNGSTANSAMPVTVSGISTAVNVILGQLHSCSLLSTGAIKCWGGNVFGQLGNGSTNTSTIPIDVTGISGATDLVSGQMHSCAVLSGGSLKCWGRNDYGQLGDGNMTNSSIPVTVSGLSGISKVSSLYNHTCAVSGGIVKCWGYNTSSQLGNGLTSNSSIPVIVSDISTGSEVAPGSFHTCTLLSDDSVKCWGGNQYGALGDGTTNNSTTPVSVQFP